MSTLHPFGGDWTEKKLRQLGQYLPPYVTIMRENPWASFRYTTYYVDAFAGSGRRVNPQTIEHTTLSLFDDDEIESAERYYRGSTVIALEVDPAFDNYLFIEKRPDYVEELNMLRAEYPDKADQIDIREGDANTELRRWCGEVDWTRHRAVVFLDPYGMSVEWTTLVALAETQATDVWILLPVGQAINRLLTRQRLPTGAWADRLTILFGTEEWKDAFYRPSPQPSLFGEHETEFEKRANLENICDFFVERLDTIFVQVAREWSVLLNSKGNPLFVMFFAASNPRGAHTAVKIASHILRS